MVAAMISVDGIARNGAVVITTVMVAFASASPDGPSAPSTPFEVSGSCTVIVPGGSRGATPSLPEQYAGHLRRTHGSAQSHPALHITSLAAAPSPDVAATLRGDGSTGLQNHGVRREHPLVLGGAESTAKALNRSTIPSVIRG